jgi:uncharacterized metal-binding protein YceD (DUF177 family)
MMTAPEFSRPLALDRIGLKEKSYEISADEKERAALAERLGIPAVKSFDATIRLRLTSGGGIVRLSGHIKAELTQICVVTLEPIATSVEEDFSRLYSVEAGDEMAEVVVEMDEDDVPDPIENGQIDMGEAAAEHLALAMDPFPRAPDAAFDSPPESKEESAEEPELPRSPFAGLAALRKKE